MNTPKSLAGFIGPVLLAVTASEALNLRIWAGVSTPVVYLNGCLLLVAGLIIVRAHNVWSLRWPVLITLVGWLAMAGGLYRMFFPAAPQAGAGVATYVGVAALFGIGAVLTAMSYRS